METKDFSRGMQIIYVPTHANKNLEHVDCEYGFVTSTNEKFVFCRYWIRNEYAKLRIKSNSEATDPNDLVIRNCYPQEVILDSLEDCI